MCVAAYMCGNLCISPSLDAIVGFELAASSSDGPGRHLISVEGKSTNIMVYSTGSSLTLISGALLCEENSKLDF